MPRLFSFPDGQALARAAAGDWLGLLERSSGPCLAALSGGGIARDFFAAVTALAGKSGAPLQDVHFFWADERCVPPSHPDSNFLLANENLLRPLGIAADKIHRLKGELPPAEAVAEGNAGLRRLAPRSAEGIPILDIVFLGLGEDGHTASLMANAPAAVRECREPYVHVANSPKPPPHRISLTYPMLAAAREVWTLVSGAGKETALRESMRPGGKTPFARVLRERAETRVYTDLQDLAAA
ncbi:MAG: 6-phosphogluconolactonase [Verrucomicrobiota bacterium]|jgi:6-phosphogluconolactonase